jgi:DNA-directed RNA polymerase specialized sigma24 family protein
LRRTTRQLFSEATGLQKPIAEDGVDPVSDSEQQLDLLLYTWLAESDDAKAEQRFSRYFRAAFPILCRYLGSMRAEPSIAEDSAQQALIKFFGHLGIERRTAEERLREASAELRPLGLADLDARRIERWRRQVGGFREAAIGFGVAREDEPGSWIKLRGEINGRVDPLRREGLQLLAVAISCSGASALARAISTICENLPQLAIPSNALLYTIAKRQFVDHLRKRRPETAHEMREPVADGYEDDVLEELNLDSAELFEEESVEVPCEAEERGNSRTNTAHQDTVEFRYRAFLEFLRAPLTRAEAALATAAARGRARTEQLRVQSLRSKFERLMAVLGALGESPQPNEEEIAQRLGLTRNQVKYAIERIREEFLHFFPDMARETRGRRKRQGVEC